MDEYLPPLSHKAVRWLRFTGLVVALVLLGWIVLNLQPVLTPIVVAFVIAYVFNPLVTRLERRGVQRLYATAGLYAIGTILLLALGLFLTIRTIEQVIELRGNIEGYIRAVQEWFAPPAVTTAPAGTTQPDDADRINWWKEVGPLLKEHGIAFADALLGFVTAVFASIFNWITVFILIPMYSFFFLWKFSGLIGTIRDHLPARSRDVVVHLVTTIDAAIANFFRGRLVVCLIVGLTTGIGWTLVGVPYSLPLGALAGVLNLVPFMSLLALPPALLSRYFGALQANPDDPDWTVPVLLTMGVYMLVQALETFVLTPTIESRSSGLHPITTVVALLIGAQWAGLLGMLLAIPIAGTLKTLAAQYVLPELRRLAAQSPDAARAEGGPDSVAPAGSPDEPPERATENTQDRSEKPPP